MFTERLYLESFRDHSAPVDNLWTASVRGIVENTKYELSPWLHINKRQLALFGNETILDRLSVGLLGSRQPLIQLRQNILNPLFCTPFFHIKQTKLTLVFQLRNFWICFQQVFWPFL